MRALWHGSGEIEASCCWTACSDPARPGPPAARSMPRAVEQSRDAGALCRRSARPTPSRAASRSTACTWSCCSTGCAAEGEPAAEVSQALFDTYVKALDHALREMGVGDLSVGKKMRKLGEAFYGRVQVLRGGLRRPAGRRRRWRRCSARTVYAEARRRAARRALAGLCAGASATRLAAQPLERLLAGEVDWSGAMSAGLDASRCACTSSAAAPLQRAPGARRRRARRDRPATSAWRACRRSTADADACRPWLDGAEITGRFDAVVEQVCARLAGPFRAAAGRRDRGARRAGRQPQCAGAERRRGRARSRGAGSAGRAGGRRDRPGRPMWSSTWRWRSIPSRASRARRSTHAARTGPESPFAVLKKLKDDEP